MKGFFAVLQQIGRSLMLPVSVLPVAGILLGVGKAEFSWMPALLAKVMATSGDSIFHNLPLIFAIGVALGFAAYDGVAAVAATVGYFVMLSTMGVMGDYRGLKLVQVTGVKTLETGVFGGILVGLLAGFLFKRYYRIELPPYLGFFAGKRFVPIVTGLCALVMGVAMSFLWPPVQAVIDVVSNFVANENPALSVTVYGVVERALIPFGLHHIWNNPFYFQIGEFLDPVTGNLIHGDNNRFMAGDKTAGIIGGAYLFKMWGLPAAAIAIWHSARPERRAEVGGIMASAAFTSFLTGITEPIEFSFLFVAPLLYGLHAALAGSCYLVIYQLGGRLGFSFSHGMIDYVLFWRLDTKPELVLLLGPIYGLIYYFVFRWAIGVFNLKTPGREEAIEGDAGGASAGAGGLAGEVLAALGGGGNLAALDACITRLRVTVRSMGAVDKERLKALGASGVLVVGDSLQAIFGTRSENLKTDIEQLLRSGPAPTPVVAVPSVAASPTLVVADLSTAQARRLLAAVGGADNVLEVTACAVTRVRLRLRQPEKLQWSELQALGARGLQSLSADTVHILVGEASVAWARALKP